jgi:DNA-binding transcriptional LysR family regulator
VHPSARPIAAGQAQHPQVQVRLADCAVEGVAARVLSGQADLGIAPEREPAPQPDAGMLFELPFALVFPQGHPLEAHEQGG